MAGKKNPEKETSSLIGEVEKYSRQIWLAGLGAYSKISKDGNKLFDTLVKDGEKAEKQAKSEVDKQVDAVKSSAQSAKSKVAEVKGIALGKWSELEEAFDKRLNSAISRLGVPSRNEVKELNSKIDDLTRKIEKFAGVSAKSSAKPVAAAKPAVKAAAKPAAPKPELKAAAKAAVKPAAKPVAAKPAAAKPAAAKPTAAKKPAVKKAATPKPTAAKPTAPAAAAAPAATSAPATATTPTTPASQS